MFLWKLGRNWTHYIITSLCNLAEPRRAVPPNLVTRWLEVTGQVQVVSRIAVDIGPAFSELPKRLNYGIYLTSR